MFWWGNSHQRTPLHLVELPSAPFLGRFKAWLFSPLLSLDVFLKPIFEPNPYKPLPTRRTPLGSLIDGVLLERYISLFEKNGNFHIHAI
jgi:hypothetical protein